MAVRFVLGPAGSGKTHHCLQELRRLEREGRPGIFLVPEQSTHTAERELLADPGLRGLRHVSVLSFTRLAFRLREEAGLPEPPRVGEAARTMLLRAVLARLPASELGPLAPLWRRQGFLAELGRFIGEVRAHGSLDFLDAVRGTRSEKLRALAAVLAAYDTARRDLGVIDPEAALLGLEPLIAQRADRLRETRVLVDGFLSWTRREREVLLALARGGAPIEIALSHEEGTRAPFAPARRTLQRVRELLQAAGVQEEPPVILAACEAGSGRFTRAELARLERRLHADADDAGQVGDATAPEAAAPAEEPPAARTPQAETRQPQRPALRLIVAPDPRREVVLWGRIIDQWIRLDPHPEPPEGVAVILRNVEPYREAIHEVFPAYGIPYFLDEPHRLLAHPRARLLLDALDVLLSGWRRDAVITFLRNPLLRHEPAAVDLLENLSLEYGRDYDDWKLTESWELFTPGRRVHLDQLRPDNDLDAEYAGEGEPGRGAREGVETESGEEPDFEPEPAPGVYESPIRLRRAFQDAETVRRGALLPLRRLESAWESEAPDGASAAARVRGLEEELLAAGRPGARTAGWRDSHPEWTARVASAMSNLLDEAARLWPGVPVSLDEFARALRQGISAARVPAVPVRFGQITIAEVQRSRLSGIRRAIAGGLNDGLFPRTVMAESILDERERSELEHAGLALGPSAEVRQEEETWFGYVALTRAADEAVLTFSRRDTGGGGMEPSLLVQEVRRVFPELIEESGGAEPEALSADEVQTPLEAADRMAAREAPADPVISGLRSAIELPGPGVLARVAERWEAIRPALEFHPEQALPGELIRRAVPGPFFETSVSRLTEFAQCPYRGFARGVLRLRPRPLAEVTPLETGTLAHAALEAFFRRPPVMAAGDIATSLAEVFRDLRGRPEFRAFEVDRASAYRWDSTRRSLERFLRVEMQRVQKSDYAQAALEARFDSRTGNAVAIPLEEGRTLLLAGRIDRIDTRVREGETLAVVIDYKRSARLGVPKEIRRGLDLQLVGYLLFAREVMRFRPAGGLYIPVLPSPVPEERLRRGEPNALGLKAAGMFLAAERDAIDGCTDLLVGATRGSEQAVAGEDELAAVINAGQGYLSSYAGSLLRGWIPARPLELKPGRLPCESCEFGALCRFRVERDPIRHEPLEGMPAVPAPPEETRS